MKEQVGEPKEVHVVRGAQETDLPKFLSQDIKTMSGPVSGDMCPNEVLVDPKGRQISKAPGHRATQKSSGPGG